LKPDEGEYESDFADRTGGLAELDAVGRGNVDKKVGNKKAGNEGTRESATAENKKAGGRE
jgi:hypothetical protein